MKWPRFSLRTLFLLITLIGIPLGWVTSQLNWIRQRHDFILHAGDYSNPIHAPDSFPWVLRLFREQPHGYVSATKEEKEKAQRLFPEAKIYGEKGKR